MAPGKKHLNMKNQLRNRKIRSNKKTTRNQASISNQITNQSSSYNTLKFNPRAYPLPTAFRTTLVYYEQVNFTAVTTPQTYIFRGNSPFDPNQTGTGSQPVGYDNLATFYEEYCCIGSRIRVDIFNTTVSAIQLAVCPTASSSSPSSYNEVVLFGGNHKQVNVDGTSRGGSSIGKIEKDQVTTRYFQQPIDRDFRSLFTTNPARQWYWCLAFQTADQVTTISVNLQIQIWYDVELSSPKIVALS